MPRLSGWFVLTGTVIGLLATAPAGSAQSGAKNGEWPTYGGDLGSTRYSALDQINSANFGKLEIAWRFKTDSSALALNSGLREPR